MMFSKKYKYRSITKKKSNKFYFFVNFFAFLFHSEFFFFIFQKKSDIMNFNLERKNFAQKGFIFKKTSSTFLRHLFKKYKPFFKGFVNLAFDFHFICYTKKNEGFKKAKELFDIFKDKKMLEKYEIFLLSYKGRFFSNKMIQKKLFDYDNIKIKKLSIFFMSIQKTIKEVKKIYLIYFSFKFIFK